jgi:hypothetical protein
MRAQAHALALMHRHTRSCTCALTNKYVMLIAFPWQQWFCERTSMLCYTYIASFVMIRVWAHLIMLSEYHIVYHQMV